MELINIDQLEARTSIKKRTLRKWTKPGQELIPCYRIGKLVRFNLLEVETWLQSKRVTPVEKGSYDSQTKKPHFA